MPYYQNIIIGGGIAGIYLAYRLKEMGEKYILLEKNDYLGGRIKTCYFHGKEISLGAGIMRDNDVVTMKLCDELDITYKSFETEFKLHPSISISEYELKRMRNDIMITFQTNKDEIKKKKFTMRDFIYYYFSPDFITKFENVIMYHDLMDADVEETIENYPLEDFFPGNSKKYYIEGGWQKLVRILSEKIGNVNIRLSEPVIEINSRKIITNKNTYLGNKIFICTDISIRQIRMNIPEKLEKTLDTIGSIPFIRCYSYHPIKYQIPNMIVPGFIGKIINIDDNILMISYTEGENARDLKNILEKYDNDVMILNKLLGNAIQNTIYKFTTCTDCVHQYWDIGIHYYKPKQTDLIKDDDNIFLVGEMVSHQQGWVNGAISSVDQTLKKLIK